MEESQLPPGFRFHPTDEELITCYLSPKVLDYRFAAKAIADVDLNKCEPWDLPAKASMGEKEWYFFSLRDRKYPTGLRTNRATDAGYWKTTGKDKEILRCNVMVGMKKTLVFYRGRAPKGEKTNWVMHEYRLQNKFPYKPAKEEWVVCRVFKKSSNAKKPPQPSGATSPSVPDSPTSAGTELGVVDHASVCMDNLVNYTTAPGCFSSMRADESSSSSNLYVNWMLSSSSSGREASSLQQQQQPCLLPWLGSSFSPFSGYQAMETANMSSLNSLLQGGDSLQQQQQQQQREHEPIWRGYGI